METTNIHYISIDTCIEKYQIEHIFIQHLDEMGAIQLIQQDNEQVIKDEQLSTLEKFIRLHYDLDINLEGLSAIHELFHQIEIRNAQIHQLQQELKYYK